MIKLANVTQLVETVWKHFVYFSPHAELVQMRSGFFETLQMDRLILLYPECVFKLLAASNCFDVTPSYLMDMFVIKYSDSGSNHRTKEEAVVMLWFDYISDCQGIIVAFVTLAIIINSIII